ncbi:MAG: hypothetical protein LBR65_00290 [Culturomica sp.]|jgi:hypothetical protein|nr:hypothetical protein [Culturomica sp.]
MKGYLLIILIGLVAAFVGILPLIRRKADRYLYLAAFVFYLIMPYVVYHISVPGIPWWLKGAVVTFFLSLPLAVSAGRGNKRCVFPLLVMSVVVGAIITFLGHFLL